MCFEFEYLYWAKLEEEARQRKEEEQARAAAAQSVPSAKKPEQPQPVPEASRRPDRLRSFARAKKRSPDPRAWASRSFQVSNRVDRAQQRRKRG